MSLFSKVSKFARSEKGKQAMEKAKDFANKPETKEKIEQVREKVAKKDTQKATGAGDAATAATGGSGQPGPQPSTPAAGGTPPINEPDAEKVGEQPGQGNPPTAP
jgi:hypothetical protein